MVQRIEKHGLQVAEELAREYLDAAVEPTRAAAF